MNLVFKIDFEEDYVILIWREGTEAVVEIQQNGVTITQGREDYDDFKKMIDLMGGGG